MERMLAPAEKPSILTVGPLYMGFAATGVGVALPGALLPVLLSRWHLQDEQGGRLFLMAWFGSSLGALMISKFLRAALMLGSLCVAAGAIGLAITNGSGVDALMALYGLGLGTTMTAISLIRQQQTAGSGTEMVRLNLVWAVGACACPSLTLASLARNDPRPLLCAVGLCFALLCGTSLLQPATVLANARTGGGSVQATFRRTPANLVAMIFLVTGVEASAGAWLTTYTRRGGHQAIATIAASTCFWAGLLLSRLFWTVFGRRLTEVRIVLGSVALMTAAATLLIASEREDVLLVAAFCLGFGIGPTYPLLLGWALRLQPGGTIFFVAGVGSACLPWATGAISTQQGSLRLGLTVPLAGALLILVLLVMSPVESWSSKPATATF